MKRWKFGMGLDLVGFYIYWSISAPNFILLSQFEQFNDMLVLNCLTWCHMHVSICICCKVMMHNVIIGKSHGVMGSSSIDANEARAIIIYVISQCYKFKFDTLFIVLCLCKLGFLWRMIFVPLLQISQGLIIQGVPVSNFLDLYQNSHLGEWDHGLHWRSEPEHGATSFWRKHLLLSNPNCRSGDEPASSDFTGKDF